MTPEQQASKLGSVGTEVIAEVLEISHPDIDTLYLVNQLENFTYQGQTYLPFAFHYTPYSRGDQQALQAKITISIVDQRVEQALLTLRGQTDVRMKFTAIYVSDGTVMTGPYDMEYSGLTMDSREQATITCTVFKDRLQRQYPRLNVTPSNAGLSS